MFQSHVTPDITNTVIIELNRSILDELRFTVTDETVTASMPYFLKLAVEYAIHGIGRMDVDENWLWEELKELILFEQPILIWGNDLQRVVDAHLIQCLYLAELFDGVLSIYGKSLALRGGISSTRVFDGLLFITF